MVDAIADQSLFVSRQIVEYGFTGIASFFEKCHRTRFQRRAAGVFDYRAGERVAPIGPQIEYGKPFDFHFLIQEWEQRALTAGKTDWKWEPVFEEILHLRCVDLLE